MVLTKINRQIWLYLLTLMLALTGCGSQVPAPEATAAMPVAEAVLPETLDLSLNVNVNTVQDLRYRDDVILIDVREDWEYADGHIPGAILLPLGQLPDRLNEIPRNQTVIAVCRSGNRSGQATNFLQQQGFENVHNMQGGMIAWDQAGYEIEK